MDELVVGFGIEPMRYKSQMVSAISNGVSKGLIGKQQLIKIIESGLPVTNDMIDVASFSIINVLSLNVRIDQY